MELRSSLILTLPDFVKEAAKKAVDNNFSHYTPVPGLAELREAIAEKLKRDNGLEYTPEQIVASDRSKTIHCQCLHEFVKSW